MIRNTMMFLLLTLGGCSYTACVDWFSVEFCDGFHKESQTPTDTPPTTLYPVTCGIGTCDPTVLFSYANLYDCFQDVPGTWNASTPPEIAACAATGGGTTSCTVLLGGCDAVSGGTGNCVTAADCTSGSGTEGVTGILSAKGCSWDFRGELADAQHRLDLLFSDMNSTKSGCAQTFGPFTLTAGGMAYSAPYSCSTGVACPGSQARVWKSGQTLRLNLTPGTGASQSWLKLTDYADSKTIPLSGSIGVKASTKQMIVGLVRGPTTTTTFHGLSIANVSFGVNSPVTYTLSGTTTSVSAAAEANKIAGKATVASALTQTLVNTSGPVAGTLTGSTWTENYTQTWGTNPPGQLVIQVHLVGTVEACVP